MQESLSPNERPIRVRCYSGRTYAERPVAFEWGGGELPVEEVLSEWLEPAGPVFRVRTRRGVFGLAYEQQADRWWLRDTPDSPPV